MNKFNIIFNSNKFLIGIANEVPGGAKKLIEINSVNTIKIII